MDALITAALAVMLVAALASRRDAVPVVLGVAFVAGTAMGATVQMSWLPGVIGLTDAAVVLAMLVVATRCYASQCAWCERGQRARHVGWIGTGKVAVSLGYAGTFGYGLDWWWYAALINGGFALQVAVAGGWLNGVGVFLGGWRRRLGGGAVGHAHHRGGA